MAAGTLKITTSMAQGAIPVGGVSFAIKDKEGRVLHSGITNANGESEVFSLAAPPRELSLSPNPEVRPYGLYDVWVGYPGFAEQTITDVEIFDGVQAILPVDMIPLPPGEDAEYSFVTPPPTAALPTGPQLQVGAPEQNAPTIQASGSGSAARFAGVSNDAGAGAGDPLPFVGVPEYITVHLGTPANTSAPNVRVRFIDYIKNVVSSEIYPTWPTNAIIANVHAVVTFALNRIYTEWYRGRGYPYDITNSTAYDQYFVPNRQIFQNISQIVDGIFNVYARRIGFRNPYFTEYCNGTTATCKGMSQWGTVTLANRGFSPLQILHNYYPNDLALFTASAATVSESFPGTALSVGSSGANVRRIQNQLNRIRANYPLIPVISNPDGYFGADTANAVRVFQSVFGLTQDGIVGRATWNRISQIWVAVTNLAALGGEGERIGLSPAPPTVVISQGARGADVIHAQFLLNFIAQFYPDIPAPIMDSVFGATTANAVRAFQRRFGLAQDGVVGPNTWRRMYEVYRTLENSAPPSAVTPPPVTPVPPVPPSAWPAFPGVPLRRGSTGANVRTLQQMLNNARRLYSAVPGVSVDGIFGPLTENSVRVFQLYAGLAVDGIVGPLTWAALAAVAP